MAAWLGQETLDRLFPTVVRYTGWAIIVWEAAISDSQPRPSLLVAAAGMIGYKEVLKWQRSRNGNGSGGREADR